MMFTSILAFLSPYKLLIKGIALVLMVIALYAAWHAFTGHYKDIGRTEIQVKFDQYKSDEDKLLQAAYRAITIKTNAIPLMSSL